MIVNDDIPPYSEGAPDVWVTERSTFKKKFHSPIKSSDLDLTGNMIDEYLHELDEEMKRAARDNICVASSCQQTKRMYEEFGRNTLGIHTQINSVSTTFSPRVQGVTALETPPPIMKIPSPAHRLMMRQKSTRRRRRTDVLPSTPVHVKYDVNISNLSSIISCNETSSSKRLKSDNKHRTSTPTVSARNLIKAQVHAPPTTNDSHCFWCNISDLCDNVSSYDEEDDRQGMLHVRSYTPDECHVQGHTSSTYEKSSDKTKEARKHRSLVIDRYCSKTKERLSWLMQRDEKLRRKYTNLQTSRERKLSEQSSMTPQTIHICV